METIPPPPVTAVTETSTPYRQCVGTNRAGDRCLRAPIPGGAVCVMHGGKAPQTIAAARQRLLEGVEPAIVRLLKFIETPPGLCEVCGRSDDTSAIVSAIRTLLDRAGLGPSATLKVDTQQQPPQPWLRWLTNDEYESLLTMMHAAMDRMAAGTRAFADGGIRIVDIPGDKTVLLPESERDPQVDSEDASYIEIGIDDEGGV